jgi:hypothetical protein
MLRLKVILRAAKRCANFYFVTSNANFLRYESIGLFVINGKPFLQLRAKEQYQS